MKNTIKLAQGFFLIPIMMAHGSLIWMHEFALVPFVLSVVYTLALIVSFAGSIEGRLFHPLSVWARAMLFIGALALALLDSDMINIAATIGIAMIAALNQLKGRQVLNARTD